MSFLDVISIPGRLVAVIVGCVLVWSALVSAVNTFVLPRGAGSWVTLVLFRWMAFFFRSWAAKLPTYRQRDQLMALYAPISLLLLPMVWLIMVTLGYTCWYWAAGISDWKQAFKVSGSSLLTLGFYAPDTLFETLLAFSEAALGLALVAVLIAYLPTIYSAFSRREVAVTMLEIRAGSPPWAITMYERFHRLSRLEKAGDMWVTWELWFAEIEESHTSLSVLPLFRSPHSDHHWVTAAGAVLDAAAIYNAVLDVPRDVQADLCIRAGYIALRDICIYFRLPVDPIPKEKDPTVGDRISITRAEFDAALDRLAEQGLPLKPDREQAWQDFAGWRVTYDRALISLCRLCMPPEAPWSSDRAGLIPPRSLLRIRR